MMTASETARSTTTTTASSSTSLPMYASNVAAAKAKAAAIASAAVPTASATLIKTAPIPTPLQDPALDNFLMRLRKKNQDKAAHKKTVDNYYSFWDGDRKTDLSNTEASVSARREHSATLTNYYYDMVTDFYEYGWGTSFHFARMFRNTSFKECITRHENYMAMRLDMKPGMEILDVGCGVGGPLREMTRFSGASITGLNNNFYQVERCKVLAEKMGLSSVANAVKGDFEHMPFPDNTFDGVYAIEATCHARYLENVYAEIFRVIKPGAGFACYEWLTTDDYDETNLAQKKIVHAIEEGNSISKLYTIPECLAALRSVGFEVVDYCDMCDKNSFLAEATEPWYETLKGNYSPTLENLGRLPMSPAGRVVTDTFITVFETLGLIPSGTRRVSQLLNAAADNLVAGGEMNIFTPMFFFLARKPLTA